MASQWFHKENYPMVDFHGLKTCLSISNLCRVFSWRVASNRLTYVEKKEPMYSGFTKNGDFPVRYVTKTTWFASYFFGAGLKPFPSLVTVVVLATLRSNYWTNPKGWQHEPCHGKRGVCLNMLVLDWEFNRLYNQGKMIYG